MASRRVRLVVEAMKRVAPLHLAEKWDNVGLIIGQATDVINNDDTTPQQQRPRVFLTNDLTESVLAEALALPPQARPDVIVSYHPTPFRSFKRIAGGDATQRIVLELIRNGIAVYSPHTALDSVNGGVNDWLARGMDASGRVEAVTPATDERTLEHSLGVGRVNRLSEPVSLHDVVNRVKAHLGLTHVRVAPANGSADLASVAVDSVAVCAGSGGSVLGGFAADVYLTGEMSHHEVLAANHSNVSVILTDHTNTERGYLPLLCDRLVRELEGEVDVQISAVDADPLRVV